MAWETLCKLKPTGLMVLWKSALGSQQTIPQTICLQTRLLLVWVVRGTLARDTLAASPSRCCALWGCVSRGWDPDTNVEWWRSSTPRICGTWLPELYSWSGPLTWYRRYRLRSKLSSKLTRFESTLSSEQVEFAWISTGWWESWLARPQLYFPTVLAVPHEGKPTPCPVPRWIPCSRSSWIQGKPTL